jgi:hypothetical protein
MRRAFQFVSALAFLRRTAPSVFSGAGVRSTLRLFAIYVATSVLLGLVYLFQVLAVCGPEDSPHRPAGCQWLPAPLEHGVHAARDGGGSALAIANAPPDAAS